jgi:hypothetical protein
VAILIRHPGFHIFAAGLLLSTLAGCSVQLLKTDVIRPVEGKLISYYGVEIPTPRNQNAPPKITNELQEKLLLQIGTMGKFRRVSTAATSEQSVLVIQTTIVKWDTGNAFLRWMGSVAELIGGIYESYAKQSVGMVSGTVGDGFLLAEFRFQDKRTQQELGRISIKGLSDDPDSFRSAEDRVVDGLIKYLLSRL